MLCNHRLTIGTGGQLNSSVRASNVFVYGTLVGTIEAREFVEIKKGGQLIGYLTAVSLTIEHGAYF